MARTPTPGKMRYSTTALCGLCGARIKILTAPVAMTKGMIFQKIATAVMPKTTIQPAIRITAWPDIPPIVNFVTFHPMCLGHKRSSSINSPSTQGSIASGAALIATSHPIIENSPVQTVMHIKRGEWTMSMMMWPGIPTTARPATVVIPRAENELQPIK